MKGIRYRARFLTRPDLDSDDFTDYVGGVVIGRTYVDPSEGTTWRIAEVQQDRSSVETIVFEPVA